MAATSARVPINVLLDADSPRLEGIDRDHVACLAEKLDKLPPILVHRSTMRVIDGMHRLHAARASNRTTIEVTYFDGTIPDCFLAAVEANIRHGLPLTLADRKESAKKILADHPEWSDRAIAAKVGLSGKTIGTLRRTSSDPAVRSNMRLGLDGRFRAVKSQDGRRRTAEALSQHPDASLRQISTMARVSAETVREVRDQRERENRLPHRDAAHGEADGSADAAPMTVSRSAASGLDRGVRARAQNTRQPSSEVRPIDLGVVLDSLKRDPTLRYNDEGRMMIRWLEARVIRDEEAEFVEHIPPHQATRIATVARACAVNWNAIATLLERRGNRPTHTSTAN